MIEIRTQTEVRNPKPAGAIALISNLLIMLVQLYRWTLSPAKTFLFGPLAGCRFTPSCAEYAQEALRKHGAGRGIWLAAQRVCRCHPWGGCGHDPVPSQESESRGWRSTVATAQSPG